MMLLKREDKINDWIIENCQREDMSLLSELRVRAIMPSLKAVNRFEAIRVVQRFTNDFMAGLTYKILLANELVGFYMIKEETGHFYLPYFYIDPNCQDTKLGSRVLTRLIEESQRINKGIRVCVLKDCQSNQFYLEQGFVCSNEEAWDIYYELQPKLNRTKNVELFEKEKAN